MNIRKTLHLILVIVIASLGLTLTGCEQKSDHPTSEEAVEVVEEAAETAEGAEVEVGVVEEAVEEHPAGEHPKGEHPK